MVDNYQTCLQVNYKLLFPTVEKCSERVRFILVTDVHVFGSVRVGLRAISCAYSREMSLVIAASRVLSL